MATVRELVTSWGFDVDDKPLRSLDDKLASLKTSVTVVGAAVAAAAATLFGLVKFTANAGEQALNTSQKIGIEVEALQELQFAAKLANVENEQLTVGLRLLANNAEAASRGNIEASRAFKTAGVQIRDSTGKLKGTDTLLMDISNAFSTMPDGIKKTALAQDIFGRSGGELIPLLNQGSSAIGTLRKEARRLGVVLSAEAAEASDKFNDSLDGMVQSIIGLRNIIGLALMPEMTRLVTEIKEWVIANRSLVKEKVKEFVAVIIPLMRAAWKITVAITEAFVGFANAIGGVGEALKILVLLVGVFMAFKILTLLGAGAIALFTIVKGITLVNIALMAMNIQMAGIPVAIGLIIAGLFLLAEDFIAFSQGRTSVIGGLVQAANGVPGWLRTVSRLVLGILEPVAEQIINIIRLLDLAGKIYQNFSEKGILGGLGGLPGVIFGSNKAGSITPRTTGVPSKGGSQTSVTQAPQLTVSVNGGMTNAETAKIVTEAVQPVLDKFMREGLRDLQGVVVF